MIFLPKAFTVAKKIKIRCWMKGAAADNRYERKTYIAMQPF